MVQILALREFFSKHKQKVIKAEVWFEKNLRAASVEEVFSQGAALIANVPKDERWNLYYTVADCIEAEGRKLLIQHHIPFDVDGIIVPEVDGKVDEAALWTLVCVVCDAIGVDPKKCGVLFSGNGVQIIVGTTNPIEDVDYFDAVRHHYGAIADRIDLRLMQAKIQGKADRSVWSPARLMRYPETWNRKPGRPERRGILLNSTIERIDFDLKKVSGLPDVPVNNQISARLIDSFPTPDVREIMDPAKGCKFLHWCQTSPEKVSEPEWYAAISITSRFPDGIKFSHKLSEGHPGYNFSEADQKIQQAMVASGPRTCKNINAISGGKCEGCIHFNTKLQSPILIEGADHVKTEKTGFYKVYVNPETQEVRKGKPDFQGLQKHFNREHKYKAVEDSGGIWVWNGMHYEEMSRDRVLQYAHEKFDPKPDTKQRSEFFQYVRLANMVSSDWFVESIEGKMNFRNGVLNVKDGLLYDHSMEYGFRSVLPCDYDPDAKAPRFEKFLQEITQNRQGLIDILQEFLGYIFANGDCKHQKVLMLLGTGENGKSKFIELVRALASKDGYSSLSIKDMNSDQNRYLMEGKLVNIAEENSKDSFRDTELLKNFVSGGHIRVKKLYSQPYEYENRTKLIMLCNRLPDSQDNTHGFYRRLLLIPFDQEFSDALGNKDPDLLEKLLAELPGIFNWVMEGYKRLHKNNRFTEHAASIALVQKYKADTNTILAWANDYIEYTPDKNSSTNRQELYDDYTRFCESNGVAPQSSIKVYDFLRQFIKKHGGVPIEHKAAEGRVRYYTINHINHLSVPTK